MAVEITMPQLSDTMDQGTILSWLKKEGDAVKRGEALAEVATDKADLEIESFHEGTLVKIHAPEGSTVKVGSIIAVIGAAGETVASQAPQQAASSSAPVSSPSFSTPAPEAVQVVAKPATAQNGAYQSPESAESQDRIKISPLAKNLAKNHGVDYSSLAGSGDGGRIVKRDIEAQLGGQQAPEQAMSASAPMQQGHIAKSQPSAPAPGQAHSSLEARSGKSVEPLSRMRETIAQRMVESVTTAPHFYVTAKLEVDELSRIREKLKELPQYEGITVTHLMIKAVGLALQRHPRINASYHNSSIVQPAEINIGIITALPDGLLIPVIKNANSVSLADIVGDVRGLVQRARSGRPKADDLVGGTFSISNIGRQDIESFTAIINPGQGAILAVSNIQDEAIVREGAVVAGKVMRVTLSVDHRIIDGVMAGEFLTELKQLVEEPVLLFA